MIGALISSLAGIAVYLIETFGYFGVGLAMAIESANIPLPSEVIMPFTGYVVSQGGMSFWPAVLAASIGGTIGSLLSYALGYYGGEKVVRKVIRKYGKYVLVFEYELEEAEEMFRKHGSRITFFARLLPVIRTFISLPAGISKMDVRKFAFYAFVGTFIWSAPLGYLGVKLGENWEVLGDYFRRFDYLVTGGIVLIGIWYVWHKIDKHKRYLKNRIKKLKK